MTSPNMMNCMCTMGAWKRNKVITGINCGIGWSLLLRICAVKEYLFPNKEYLFVANKDFQHKRNMYNNTHL